MGTRKSAPLQFATTQNNLGNALMELGRRENGTARFEQAVAAYRAALEARPRNSAPIAWAHSEYNLGNTLAALGERESGTARLEEAVATYRAALEDLTRDRVPLDWATTQNNLGNALTTLGERESGTARLEEAVAAYRAALKERTRRAGSARLGGDPDESWQCAFQIVLTVALVMAAADPIGGFMADVFENRRTFLMSLLTRGSRRRHGPELYRFLMQEGQIPSRSLMRAGP